MTYCNNCNKCPPSFKLVLPGSGVIPTCSESPLFSRFVVAWLIPSLGSTDIDPVGGNMDRHKHHLVPFARHYTAFFFSFLFWTWFIVRRGRARWTLHLTTLLLWPQVPVSPQSSSASAARLTLSDLSPRRTSKEMPTTRPYLHITLSYFSSRTIS